MFESSLRRVLAAIVFLASTLWLLGADPPQTFTNTVEPTVTVAMTNAGGKFFGKVPDPTRTRHYYIAAEPQRWDYAPEGRDPICGKPLPASISGKQYGSKIRYVQYT